MGSTKVKKVEEEVIKEVVIPSEVSEESADGESGDLSLDVRDDKSQSDTKVETKSEEKAAEPKKKAEKKSKRAAKKGKIKYRSKKYLAAMEGIEKTQQYPIDQAVENVKKSAYAKFPASVEAHINTAVKNIRGLTLLPFASGKKLTIVAFGPSTALRIEDENVILGNEETIAEIQKGKINFDVVVTTPDWMPKLAVVAKFLGPRGLMPNPKSGTITDNLAKAVSELQGGKVEYKTEKDGKVIHMNIGKATQPTEEIAANLKALYLVIGKSKIKKVTLSASMGPGIKVQLNSL